MDLAPEVLGQFSRARAKALREYRQFVSWGINKETIWTDVKSQILLGDADFVDSHADHLRKHRTVPEITSMTLEIVKKSGATAELGLDAIIVKRYLLSRKRLADVRPYVPMDAKSKLPGAWEREIFTAGERTGCF